MDRQCQAPRRAEQQTRLRVKRVVGWAVISRFSYGSSHPSGLWQKSLDNCHSAERFERANISDRSMTRTNLAHVARSRAAMGLYMSYPSRTPELTFQCARMKQHK